MLVIPAAMGQILECVDARGGKTIAQFCPPGTVRETQLNKGGTGTPDPGAATDAKSFAERDAEFRKRKLERQDAAAKSEKEATDREEAERNCNNALSAVRQLQDGLRIVKIDPDTGERSFLEDADRAVEIENAQKAADGWCNKR